MKSKLNKTLIALLTFGALGLAASGAQAGWDHHGYGPSHAFHPYKQSQLFGQQINAQRAEGSGTEQDDRQIKQ